MDVFLYRGALRRSDDLRFIEFVSKNIHHESVTLIVVTYGGDPDAAYKIGKYLQSKYEKISVLIPGLCKSAGTLLAIAGDELVFTPYGELGPLDIQLTKTDKVAALESGLSIVKAFETLENNARSTFLGLVQEIVAWSGGVVSYQTAAHSAAEMIGGLYGPIFSRIDPEEVGSRTRAMQIAADYGRRLDKRFQNLRCESIDTLAQTYPSHSFVVDQEEASELFHRVRDAAPAEKGLVEALGFRARFPGTELEYQCLTEQFLQLVQGKADHEDLAQADQEAGDCGSEEARVDEGNPPAAGFPRRKKPHGAEAAVAEEG